jgi:6-phosphogluconolactonase
MKFAQSISSILILTALSSSAALAQVTTAAPKQVRHSAVEKKFFLYLGTFIGSTPGGHPDGKEPSKGIYMARFNAKTGALSAPVLAAEIANPTFLTVSANQRFLYSITESDPEAFVSSYAINPRTGDLRLLNKLPTGGSGTAYLSLDKTGKFILLANYGSASVTAIQVNADGSLGKLTSYVQHSARRTPGGGPPAVPRPHSTIASPDNRFVLVPDLGLNKIFVYKFDGGKGVLSYPATITDLPPGDGPRHFVFSPDGKFGYMIAQTSGNVEVFRWDAATGTLSPVQTATSAPKDLDAVNMSAEIGMTPNGKFLYESNRRTHGSSHDLGPDSIVAYQVNQQTGTLTEVQDLDRAGSIPRCFMIDPTGGYMVIGGQQTNNVSVFRIDQENGKLSDSGVSIPIHTPACMQFAHAQ